MSLLGKVSRKVKKAIGIPPSVKVGKEDQKLLETIRKCIELDSDATDEQREMELDDLRFCDPTTHWSDEDRRSREEAGRPCLTEDRLGPFLGQVCNEQRKNKPGCQVNPVDDSGDPETAEVIQGLIRHIEYNSNADTAYDTAFEWAVKVGRGFYRVCTDYVDNETFQQEILIKRVMNPHSVFVDPSAVESDYSDMKWGGFKVWMSKEDFEEQYSESQTALAGKEAWASIGDDAPDWMSRDGGACMVVEFFWKDEKKVAIEVDGKTREAYKTTVKWVKCTAIEILERGEFPSRYIPIIAVLGKEHVVNGKRTYMGLIRSGKDPQKRHNYLLTSQVERIAFMPISTWLGAKGFMGKEKKFWARAHKEPMASLEYEITGDDGKDINPPQLITAEAPIRAVTEAMEGAEQGMKAVLGMYDPSLGNREGAQSGIAIGRLQAQGETGNFHFQDNLSRAIRYEGRILLDLIPKIYDTERVIRIIGEDQTQKTVRINAQPTEDDGNDQRQGIKSMYDLTTGRYDVTVSAGPSYQSKRQEDRALLMGMLQGPMGEQIAMAAPDLIASTLDSPVAKKLSERLKKLLPPQLQEQEEGQQQIPPQVQGMIQQMQQQGQAMAQRHEALIAKVQELTGEIEAQQAKLQADLAKAQLDSQTKLEIARMNNETELIKTQATIEAKAAENQILAQLSDLQGTHGQLQELVLAMSEAMQRQHESQETPAEEAAEPPHEETPAGEAKVDPMHKIMEGHSAALSAIAEALKRAGGRKKIVMDEQGNPVGMEPVEEGE